MFCLCAFADPITWHVARETGDDAAAALDATGATAFQSIQAAVNKAKSGDTILVGPGVYDNETGTDTKTTVNRVWISGKTLTIKSTAGAANTHIVGRWDTSTASNNGCGTAQIRCVCVNNDCSGTVIEGFTLRDGATRLDRNTDDIPQLGGGLAVYSQKKDVYLVDCVISNCTACWGGAMRGGTAVRCLITGNTADQTPGGPRQANLYSSVVVRNRKNGCGLCGAAVNCTFSDNASLCDVTTSYNCLYGFDDTSKGTVKDGVKESEADYQMFAPLVMDYRILAGSVAATAGDPAHLTGLIGLPADCEGKDFNGKVFPVSGGKIAVGAISDAVTPACGGIRFQNKVIVQGVPQPASYAFFDKWPQQVCVKPFLNEGETFFRYKVTGANTDYGATSRWLQPDGTLWIVPPFRVGTVMTNEAVLTSRIIWADANYTGGDSDGSEEKPYATLADAVADTVGGVPTIIYVKEGDYNRGEVWEGNHSNRVAIADGRHILLKAVGRVEKTILRGRAASPERQQQPTYYPGCGSDAVRCLYLGTANSAGAIQGFTIADGRSNCNNYTTDDTHDRCGGIRGPSTDNPGCGQALDCVFTNCAAVRGGAFYGIWASRCRMYDCRAYGGVVRYGVLSSTYVDRSNVAADAGTIPSATANYVVGGSTASVHLSLDWPSGASYRTANALYQLADTAQRWEFKSDVPYYGTVARKSGTGTGPLGATYGAPQFVNEDHSDFRQLSTSCCAFGGGTFADDGNTKYADAMSFYATYAATDMNGQPIRFKDGVPTPGAWQVPVAALATTSTSGSLSVNGSTAAVTNVLPETVVVRVEKGTRPLVGFAVNDTEYAYDGSKAEWLFSANDYPADETFAVTPIFGTNWYVSASKPDNSGDGFTPATAKRTFHGTGGVMTNVKEGDCVHADEGAYDEESAVPTGFLRRRLVVPAGATVVADKGPEKTFIVGARATESGVEGYEVDEWGRGTNAIACVYLKSTESKAAVVRGFTLTGGCTHYYYGESASVGYWDNNTIGGAALAVQSYDQAFNGRVEDCIVSNNVSCRGGAFNSVNAVNCRVFGNTAESGGASANAFHQGCLVDFNRGEYALSTPRAVWNCTIGSGNVAWGGGWTCGIYDSYGKNGGVFNTLCLGYAQNVTNANNSYFLKHATRTNVDIADSRIIACRLLEADEMPIDAAYAPIIGTSPAVDKGKPELAAHGWYGDHDAYGNPRAVNGWQMDIGAVEADWRSVYSHDIAKSGKFAVTSADPGIVETADRTVAVHNGETVRAVWRNPDVDPRTYTLSVKLSEVGTLTIFLNGEKLQDISAAGTTNLTFKGPLAENELVFAYAGNGVAELLTSRCEIGMVLIVR